MCRKQVILEEHSDTIWQQSTVQDSLNHNPLLYLKSPKNNFGIRYNAKYFKTIETTIVIVDMSYFTNGAQITQY